MEINKEEKEPVNVDFTEVSEDEQDGGLTFLDEETEEKPEPTAPETPENTGETEEPEQPEPTTATKSKAQKFAAKKIARIIEELNNWSFEPWAISKMKRKIYAVIGTTSIEWDELCLIIDTNDTDKLEQDKIDKAKKLFNRWEKKIEQIPFSNEESAELQSDLQAYMEATGKLELSPETSLIIGILGLMSKRAGLIMLS